MKGISTVLAIVLIVVITVGIIGMAYVWSTGMFETVSSSSEEQVEQKIITATASFEVRSATDNLLYVRNTGKTSLSGFTVFKNTEKIPSNDLEIIPAVLDEGNTGEIRFLAGKFAEVGEENTITVITTEGAQAGIEIVNEAIGGISFSRTYGGGVIGSSASDSETETCIDLTGLDEYILTENTILCKNIYEMPDNVEKNGAIIIAANDITLDCNGATIQGTGGANYNGYGIIIENVTGVTVKNCIVREYSYAINMSSGSEYNTIIDNTIIKNLYGIYSNSANWNKIISNEILNNSNYGIVMYSLCSYNTIDSNNIFGGDRGIHMYQYSQFNNITNNIISSAVSQGINAYDYVRYNNFINNTITSTGWMGIYLVHQSNENNIIGNRITFTQSTSPMTRVSGLYIKQSSGNIISENYIDNNEQTGILFHEYSRNNTVNKNIITNHFQYGIFLDHIACTNNLFYDNKLENNTVNANDDSPYSDAWKNYWNTTKILGTNIVGGSYLGGNFFDDYVGIDSDIDGIGDTSYPISGGMFVDELPLMK